jgi:hypothetical protein
MTRLPKKKGDQRSLPHFVMWTYRAIIITAHQRDQDTIFISSLVLVDGGDFEVRALAGEMLGDQAELRTVH